VLNRLRSRVRVQVDGQIKTGRDVLIGALLGAEEFGFATAPLVVQGCIMMRKCHLNTCPVGVATQDPVLRKKFTGQPEHVVNYFFFIAEEVRELMAQMGVRTFEELIGRADLLDMRQGITHWKAQGLDFSKVFHQVPNAIGDTSFQTLTQDHGLDNALDKQLIAQCEPALLEGKPVSFIQNVRNLNRSIGAMLSGQVARRYGHAGLPDDTIHIQMNGTAGQSFGAFLAHGVTFDLVGEANDYVGKGLSGGRIIVRPNNSFRGASHENIIVGNTVLYGAIAGSAFFSGVAGERFAVRNSGAACVVEGTGDHGCEYMTGGTVVVLGATGRNFAAGMSGGVAYVYDPAGQFEPRCNTTMVALSNVVNEKTQAQSDAVWHAVNFDAEPASDEANLKSLIEQHFKFTGSARAREILDNWSVALESFVKVMPIDYRKVLEQRTKKTEAA
jgi:glutamate synthase (NADPH/NADH) large chain